MAGQKMVFSPLKASPASGDLAEQKAHLATGGLAFEHIDLRAPPATEDLAERRARLATGDLALDHGGTPCYWRLSRT